MSRITRYLISPIGAEHRGIIYFHDEKISVVRALNNLTYSNHTTSTSNSSLCLRRKLVKSSRADMHVYFAIIEIRKVAAIVGFVTSLNFPDDYQRSVKLLRSNLRARIDQIFDFAINVLTVGQCERNRCLRIKGATGQHVFQKMQQRSSHIRFFIVSRVSLRRDMPRPSRTVVCIFWTGRSCVTFVWRKNNFDGFFLARPITILCRFFVPNTSWRRDTRVSFIASLDMVFPTPVRLCRPQSCEVVRCACTGNKFSFATFAVFISSGADKVCSGSLIGSRHISRNPVPNVNKLFRINIPSVMHNDSFRVDNVSIKFECFAHYFLILEGRHVG